MQSELEKAIQLRYKTRSLDHSHGLTGAHNQMLALRRLGLNHIAREISLSMGVDVSENKPDSSILFDHNWLVEFATGDIVKCLGTEFDIYKNRRSPRIPNGDLLLMTRIMGIQGARGEFTRPAHISAELDIPADAWFFEGTTNGEIPLSILLEIALQPCGVLSAWVGTQLRYPLIDFFFRNLDGDVLLTRKIDARGKTVHTNATLTRTVFSGSTIIQHFEFDLFCDGAVFFHGTSSFGYFPEESMASQNGLDGGNSSVPWGKKPENISKIQRVTQQELLLKSNFPAGKLRLIDEINISLQGNSDSKGYVMASRQNSSTDWFYANHFYQDPVMPGSLGIEAVMQAFKAAIQYMTKSDSPITLVPGVAIKWKYRGQVLQHHHEMLVDFSIQDQQRINGSHIFSGNGNLWADNIRIYEIQNLAAQQKE